MKTQKMRPTVVGTFVLAAACVLAPSPPAGAADQDGSEGQYRPARAEFDVESKDATWTDAARGRDVPVRVYAPDLMHRGGPYPTIVFSHGGGESRASFDYLGRHWAACGYIAVFLTHAGTDRDAVERARGGGAAAFDGSGRRFELRPQDVHFVVEFLLGGKTGIIEDSSQDVS
jgi:predicted dienelactone hydrolase